MGCVPSKAKVLSQDAGPQAATPAGNTKRSKQEKTGPPSQDTPESQPPWLQAPRAKLIVEKDGSVQFKPTS